MSSWFNCSCFGNNNTETAQTITQPPASVPPPPQRPSDKYSLEQLQQFQKQNKLPPATSQIAKEVMQAIASAKTPAALLNTLMLDTGEPKVKVSPVYASPTITSSPTVATPLAMTARTESSVIQTARTALKLSALPQVQAPRTPSPRTTTFANDHNMLEAPLLSIGQVDYEDDLTLDQTKRNILLQVIFRLALPQVIQLPDSFAVVFDRNLNARAITHNCYTLTGNKRKHLLKAHIEKIFLTNFIVGFEKQAKHDTSQIIEELDRKLQTGNLFSTTVLTSTFATQADEKSLKSSILIFPISGSFYVAIVQKVEHIRKLTFQQAFFKHFFNLSLEREPFIENAQPGMKMRIGNTVFGEHMFADAGEYSVSDQKYTALSPEFEATMFAAQADYSKSSCTWVLDKNLRIRAFSYSAYLMSLTSENYLINLDLLINMYITEVFPCLIGTNFTVPNTEDPDADAKSAAAAAAFGATQSPKIEPRRLLLLQRNDSANHSGKAVPYEITVKTFPSSSYYIVSIEPSVEEAPLPPAVTISCATTPEHAASPVSLYVTKLSPIGSLSISETTAVPTFSNSPTAHLGRFPHGQMQRMDSLPSHSTSLTAPPTQSMSSRRITVNQPMVKQGSFNSRKFRQLPVHLPPANSAAGTTVKPLRSARTHAENINLPVAPPQNEPQKLEDAVTLLSQPSAKKVTVKERGTFPAKRGESFKNLRIIVEPDLTSPPATATALSPIAATGEAVAATAAATS